MDGITTLASNRILNSAVKVLAAIAVIIMAIVGITVYKADLSSLLILFLFAVFYVQLPGLSVLQWIRIRYDHISTNLCVGFFAGWAFITAQYFLCELIHNDILLYVLGPAASVFYIVSRIMKGRASDSLNCGFKRFRFSALSTALCIFIAGVLYYALASTQYLYLSPEIAVSTYMNPDKAYHMGLIDSLSHGWPLVSLWVQGRIIKYHVFTELLMAVPVRLFGVPADVAIFSFNPYMTTYVFGLSTYVFFREMLKRKERAGLCALAVLLSNLFICRGIKISLAFHFAIINDNAVGYGISGAMIFVVLLRNWYVKFEAGEKQLPELLALTVFVMLLTGIKGPIAIVLIGALWGTYVIGLILRQVPFKTVLPLLLISIAFLIVYMTVMGGKGTSNGSGESIFAFATIANIAFYHDPLILLLKGMGIPKILRLGCMLVVFMIFFLTAFIVPFTAGFIRELILVFSKKKAYVFYRVLVYAAFLVGLAGMFLMNYSGHSQVYFGFVSCFFAPLITFWFFEDMEGNKGALMKLVRIIFFVCLILTSFTLVWHLKGMTESAQFHTAPNIEYNTYQSISQPEYEAMVWIRKNTPKDALLATDRYSSVPMEEYSYENRWTNRFFLYATYANRFCYIAGSGYNLPAGDWVIRKEMIETNNKIYDVNNPDRGKLAKELGVDYVVVSKRFGGNPNLGNEDLVQCFSNEDVDIYKVK